MILRRARWGLVALFAASPACFDSDETFKVAATTTGATTTTTTDPTTTSTTTDPTTSGSTTGSDATCRDAIDCIFECAALVEASMTSEPDLSCFLECEETLPIPEAYKLLLLGNCAADQCRMMGDCAPPDPTTGGSDSSGSGGSDSGGSDSGSSGSSSSSSSDSGQAPPPPPDGPLDPCIMCIFVLMLDEQFEGCAEFELACQ